MIFGGIYDIIRIVHVSCGIASYTGETKGMKRGFIPLLLFFLTDAAYMLTVTCIFSVFLFAVNRGGFRFYLLAGVIAGMTLYLCTIGRLVMLVSETIVRLLRRMADFLLFRPLRFLAHLLFSCICRIGRMTAVPLLFSCRRAAAIHYTEKIRRQLTGAIRFNADPKRGKEL
ncbi:MAG: hypothetical protein IJC71_08660 [Clostridia bacterium]|nr:hypothetical protein [Clostridia bacterium]